MTWLTPKFAGKSDVQSAIELGVGKELSYDTSTCHIRIAANEVALTNPTGLLIPTNRCLVLWATSFES